MNPYRNQGEKHSPEIQFNTKPRTHPGIRNQKEQAEAPCQGPDSFLTSLQAPTAQGLTGRKIHERHIELQEARSGVSSTGYGPAIGALGQAEAAAPAARWHASHCRGAWVGAHSSHLPFPCAKSKLPPERPWHGCSPLCCAAFPIAGRCWHPQPCSKGSGSQVSTGLNCGAELLQDGSRQGHAKS